jgi:hypothetical protein
VKIFTRTPAGTALGFTVYPTGNVRELGGKIRSVEVRLPGSCVRVRGYTVDPLPKDADGSQLLWAEPGDLCADDGARIEQQALRMAIHAVNVNAAASMSDGPLGKNWP